MPRKTPAEVDNINARAALSTARTLRKIHDIIAAVPELERGTIDRAIDRAHTVGWGDGIRDYTEGD